MRRKSVLYGGTAWLALVAFGNSRRPLAKSGGSKDPSVVPALPREFRGMWVATVANIDWPSRPGLTAARQRAELDSLLDRARKLHLNAVILQVRPACDALYPSEREPWSESLTGKMGRDPGWDPLAHAVEAAHARRFEPVRPAETVRCIRGMCARNARNGSAATDFRRGSIPPKPKFNVIRST